VVSLGLLAWFAVPFRVLSWHWMGRIDERFRMAASMALIGSMVIINAAWAFVVFLFISAAYRSRPTNYPHRFQVFEVRVLKNTTQIETDYFVDRR
jgi:hypothetical protein